MKKLKFLIPTLVMTVLFTGCGQNPETVLKNAAEKMNNLDNYHMTMQMDMNLAFDGSSMSMSVKAESDIDEKNGVGVMDTTASIFGVTSTERSYMTYKDNITTTYTQDEDETWYKKEEAYEEPVNFDIFSNTTTIEEVKDEEGTYKISLTEDQIKELMGSMEDTEGYDVNLNNVVITVTVKAGYITKLIMTMPMSMTEEGQTINVDAVLTFEFSKFNEVTVTIPENVIANAIDIKPIEIENYVSDYIFEIEWNVEEDTTTYTNTDLEYDGPKPTKVDLTLEDGYVVSGVIEMDGYKAVITDGNIEVTKID